MFVFTGPGKAKTLWERDAAPVFRAANFELDVICALGFARSLSHGRKARLKLQSMSTHRHWT